jgi:hypothetical protein
MTETGVMSEEPVEQPVPSAPAPDAFAALFNLLALIADQRAFKTRLSGLSRALEAVTSGEKKLAAARAAFDAHEASARAELGKREQAVRAREVAASVAEETLREHQADLVKQGAEIRRQDLILRRRVMVLARLDAVDERMQSLPSWKQISAELLNAEQLDLADEAEAVTEQPAGLPPGVTLTQTMHRGGRRSARRVSAEAS